MNDPRSLAEIHRLAKLDRIAYSSHAFERMDERGAALQDVRAALVTSTSAALQERGTWRVEGGRDRDGDDMTVIVDIGADLLVVTIF